MHTNVTLYCMDKINIYNIFTKIIILFKYITSFFFFNKIKITKKSFFNRLSLIKHK